MGDYSIKEMRKMAREAEENRLIRQYAAHAQWYIDATGFQLAKVEVTRAELLEKIHAIQGLLLHEGFKFPVLDNGEH